MLQIRRPAEEGGEGEFLLSGKGRVQNLLKTLGEGGKKRLRKKGNEGCRLLSQDLY